MTIDNLKQLYQAKLAGISDYQVALVDLGNPSEDEIISYALLCLRFKEKNERVLALRVLGSLRGISAASGILLGLKDCERRVRKVAIQVSKPFHHYPEVIERLVSIINDEEETSKLRQQALGSLAGFGGGSLSTSAISALEKLSRKQAYRKMILLGIAQVDLTTDIKRLLVELSQHASEQEKKIIRIALNGYKATNLGFFDKETRAEIAKNNQLAFGSVWYWIKRDGADTLSRAPRERLE